MRCPLKQLNKSRRLKAGRRSARQRHRRKQKRLQRPLSERVRRWSRLCAGESVEHGKERASGGSAGGQSRLHRIRKDAEAEADQLRQAAQLRLEKAADFIVEGVVKH